MPERQVEPIVSAAGTYLLLFRDGDPRPIDKVLRKGFRHCAVILRTHRGWRFVDPLRSGLVQKRFANVSTTDLFKLYTKLGYCVVVGRAPKQQRTLGIPRNCVDVCKRLISLDNVLIITPYQLYRFVTSTPA